MLAAVGAAVTLVVGGGEWLRGAAGAEEVVASAPSSPASLVTPSPVASSSVPPSASPSPEPPVLRLPGPVPSAGRGSFEIDDRTGPVLGTAGRVRGYRVAVEVGSGVDPAEFALAVQEALTGPGSWVDSGRLRLRQVAEGAAYDFTVYLATARTAGRMCAAGGVDIRIGGRPYTSCRAPGKAIINLERWRLSVPHYVEAKVPLTVYRTYVINHEVGHELGHRHERCPGKGKPAPVMMQQTLFLNGCVANPWPYLDGRRYAGPSL
ncbi:lipoprotein [Micromonospora qiuiae]|uniref:Lipoprotein n=1 Tax=Micromonospora qiuiae TaxID=502268 RepID=A0ABQ4J7Z8_9ACTN|nr:lipoprotein [Micromonospora qiuiae]